MLVPKSRHLQHDGDLRLAESLALYDVEHHQDQAQLAGGLQVLGSIYKQSGRYDQALATANRYEQVLAGVPNADASARQDCQLLLAEILANLEKYPEAISHVDQALKVPRGMAPPKSCGSRTPMVCELGSSTPPGKRRRRGRIGAKSNRVSAACWAGSFSPARMSIWKKTR